MPELAPLQTHQPEGTCPSSEELACYIDRALSPEAASQVAAHLASCENCFEVYSEVLQFRLESEDVEPETGKVVQFPAQKRERERQWYRIAALLLIGLGASGTYGYLHLLASPPELTTAQMTAPLHGNSALWLGPTTRGPGGEEDVKLQEASFKMGVQIVNLQVSLQAGKAEEAENVIAYILGILSSQPLTNELQDGYKQIKSALIEGRHKPADLLGEASRLAGLSRGAFDSAPLDFGQWVEAGRLASLSSDPTFFRLSDSRSFLRRSLWRDRLGIAALELPNPQGSRGELNSVYTIAGQDSLSSADFVALRNHFGNILKANYPE